jgi:YggT family protein
MNLGRSFLVHWYYHVPDIIMAALIYLLLARLLLSLLWRGHGELLLLRLVNAMTNPVLKVIGALTPRVVPSRLIVLCAMAWLLAARIALFMGVSATGVRLSLG